MEQQKELRAIRRILSNILLAVALCVVLLVGAMVVSVPFNAALASRVEALERRQSTIIMRLKDTGAMLDQGRISEAGALLDELERELEK